MAVHIPLSFEARSEAWKLMWSQNNLISPSIGQPLIVPRCGYVYFLLKNFLIITEKKKLTQFDFQRRIQRTHLMYFMKTFKNLHLFSSHQECLQEETFRSKKMKRKTMAYLKSFIFIQYFKFSKKTNIQIFQNQLKIKIRSQTLKFNLNSDIVFQKKIKFQIKIQNLQSLINLLELIWSNQIIKTFQIQIEFKITLKLIFNCLQKSPKNEVFQRRFY
eukprot:TRINITY_DN1447_c0_g1_i1.p2 TRINITY_DN1447_c0_g1~~TRINITY_DN1447_c0_g1_i1.p2  ORF type:complete len:217 (-),score=-9.32 TRINITY_DN1447_c0_g1_i1:523-1173(-)